MPAPARPAFVDDVLGRLLPLGPIRARAMSGGWGLFLAWAELGQEAARRARGKRRNKARRQKARHR